MARLNVWLGPLFFLAAGFFSALAVPAGALAQPPADPKPMPPMPPAETPDLREQTIYVPYNKLRGMFEKPGRGVFLPYDKFQELWQAARAAKVAPPDDRPPVGALLSDIESEAVVERDMVRVTAKLKIELLTEGWHKVPLRLSDASLLSAKIGDKPARVITEPNGGYSLILEKKGKEPAQLEAVIEYAKAVTKAPGQNSVAFEAPQAPVNRWKFRVPQAGVKVNIQPLVATTDEPPMMADAKETALRAFIGAAPSVRIDWMPKAEGAAGLTALASVQAEEQVSIEEGILRTTVRLNYDITRAELSQLAIEVPGDQTVKNVFDANLRKWSVEKAGEKQKIVVELFQPAKGKQSLTIEMDAPRAADAKEVLVPEVKALDAGRQEGTVVVEVGEGLRADVGKVLGLSQVDVSELPPGLQGRAWPFAYRYASPKYELRLNTEKVLPRVTTEELVEAHLTPESLTLSLLAQYTIERAGIFQLEIDIPEGYELRKVEGRSFQGQPAVSVESHRVEALPAMDAAAKGRKRLVINLARKATGKVVVYLELYKRLSDTKLQQPSEKETAIDLLLPRVAPASRERTTTNFVVFAPASLSLTGPKIDGVRAVNFQEAVQAVAQSRQNPAADMQPAMIYAISGDVGSVTIQAERKQPDVTVRQLLVVRVEPRLVKYSATFYYDILHSGVKTLRIDIPKSLEKKINNESETTLRWRSINPQPEKLAADTVAYQLITDGEFLGSHAVQFTWEQPLTTLDYNKPEEIELPHLQPKDVKRAWGQIVITKTENIDVSESEESKPQNLQGIDPRQDLMPGANVPDAARAFEFHKDDWKLTLKAMQYKLEDVKRTSIELAHVRFEITRTQEQVNVHAAYRLRTARQRILIELPKLSQKLGLYPDSFRINGKDVQPEIGPKPGQYFLPLIGHTPDTNLVLEAQYPMDAGPRLLEQPIFLDDAAMQSIYATVYMPEEWKLVSQRGPWSDEQNWTSRYFPIFDWDMPISLQSNPHRSDDEIRGKIFEGLSYLPAKAMTGKPYLFSSVRPPVGEDGALRLTTIEQTSLWAIVVVCCIALGAALVFLPIGTQAAILALTIAGLITVGVFAPNFVRQLFDGVLVVSALLMVLVLGAWHLAQWQQARSAALATAAPAAPLPSSTPPTPPAAEPTASTSAAPPVAPPPETPPPGSGGSSS